ncbi:Regulator of RpoS [uncultured archaeon]|nr:Regulator of RpoS [uncultured archaeon]
MKKILILEDDPDAAMSMKLLAESGGYSADISLDYREAISKMKKYDLLLLDLILMPEMTGRKVLDLMGKLGIETPVIVVSAVALRRTVAEEISQSHPEVGFVSKTDMHTDLLPAIRKKIEK